MELIDFVILAAILVPALAGLVYGFLNIILSITAWAVALVIAAKFGGIFSGMLTSYLETDIVRDALAFTGTFLASLLVLTALGYFMLKLVGRTGLTAADRLLGLTFGLVLGGSIVAVAVFLGGFTEMGRTPWWQQSLLVGPFERAAVWGRRFLPENIAKYHQYGPGDMADNQGG